MTEHDLQTYLADLFENAHGAEGDPPLVPIAPELSDPESGVRRVSTFAEAGVLTGNAGLVVRLGDGHEFQITLVRSR